MACGGSGFFWLAYSSSGSPGAPLCCRAHCMSTRWQSRHWTYQVAKKIPFAKRQTNVAAWAFSIGGLQPINWSIFGAMSCRRVAFPPNMPRVEISQLCIGPQYRGTPYYYSLASIGAFVRVFRRQSLQSFSSLSAFSILFHSPPSSPSRIANPDSGSVVDTRAMGAGVMQDPLLLICFVVSCVIGQGLGCTSASRGGIALRSPFRCGGEPPPIFHLLKCLNVNHYWRRHWTDTKGTKKHLSELLRTPRNTHGHTL